MIQLVNAAQPTPPTVLDTRGGFAWWYVDIVDDDGNGAVVIWSWGLPFVPGYTAAARRGQAPPARERPSLNIAIYRDGRPAYYLLQTYAEQDAACHADRWTLGQSHFARELTPEHVRLEAHLRGVDPATGHTFSGELRLDGVPCDVTADRHPDPHTWGPVTTGARATLDLRLGERSWHVAGTGYHDRNWSPVHLDALGIRRWTWFRAASPAGTRILYVLEGTQPASDRTLHLFVHPDGHAVTVEGETSSKRSSLDLFGLRYPSELRVGDGDLRIGCVLDRGPFYLRALATWTHAGVAEHGIAEVVVPARVDRAVTRPLVRMAVDDVARRRSMWFPLFAGPADGRLTRLVRGPEVLP